MQQDYYFVGYLVAKENSIVALAGSGGSGDSNHFCASSLIVCHRMPIDHYRNIA